jgi:Putative Actinobacterial Holin-X, holin superfamily III
VAPRNGNQRLGVAAKQVAEHASTLTRLEVELAQLELKQKAQSLGVGVGVGAGAAVLAVYGLGFLLATAAAALALVLDWWLALLIVTAVLFLAAGIAGVIAVGRVRNATPPVPEQAIEEAKLTTEAIKH